MSTGATFVDRSSVRDRFGTTVLVSTWDLYRRFKEDL
jgi:hypothetical protein